MFSLKMIHFLFVSALSLIMFQFPTNFGLFRTPWMQSLRFVRPLTFFIFLNLPIVLLHYQHPEASWYYMIFYGLAFFYFAASSVKDKKMGFNFITALMLLSLVAITYIVKTNSVELIQAS